MTEVISIIIMVPCSPTISTYTCEVKTWWTGESSSVLIAIANRPAVQK